MYGASYKGSGIVTHKLSLYRHICNVNNNSITLEKKLNSSNENITNGKKLVNTDLDLYDDIMNHNSQLLTSLVFGAGTVQWSYALSDFHDGTYQPEDLYLQQATINLLADMGVQPASLDGGKKKVLKVALKSTDYVPPRSTIDYPLNGSIFTFKNEKKMENEKKIRNKGIDMGGSFVIKGRSKDHGGGHVAGISISFDFTN